MSENKVYVASREVFDLDGHEATRFRLPEIFKLNADLYMNTAIGNAVYNTKEGQYDSQVLTEFLRSKQANLLKIEKILLY